MIKAVKKFKPKHHIDALTKSMSVTSITKPVKMKRDRSETLGDMYSSRIEEHKEDAPRGKS